jgi:hypothetical protein
MRSPVKILFLSLCWAFVTTGIAEDLLEPRDWKSLDGMSLKAELVRLDGHKVSLKREKDGRVFPFPLEKLSKEDQDLIASEAKKIDQMAVKAVDKHRYFVGLPDTDESVWGLAVRLDKHRVLWEAISQASWQSSEAGTRLLKITPKRMVREEEGQYLIEGEHVTLRLVAESGYKINVSGEKLILISETNVKKTLAEKGKQFSPFAWKEDLVECRLEKIGTREVLVMTLKVSRSRY